MKNRERKMKNKNWIKTALMIATLFLSVIMLAFNVQLTKADSQTVYINPDGSITPPGAPIVTSDKITYSFTGNISFPTYNGIVDERNNTVIDGTGYTLQGNLGGYGLNLTDISNVTIKNIDITGFGSGICLNSSSNVVLLNNNVTGSINDGIDVSNSSSNTLSGNDISGNSHDGIYLSAYSSYNTLSGNNVSKNLQIGIEVNSSSNTLLGNIVTKNSYSGFSLWGSNNIVSCNNIYDNPDYGLYLESTSSNSVTGNNITGNNITGNGVGIKGSPNNQNNAIYHNNFINNLYQTQSAIPNFWDDGYPSGGNYWSTYNGTDYKCGPSQDHPGSDGIGDTPYPKDSTTDKYPPLDNYPLMNPWTSPAGHDVAVIAVISNKTVIFQGFIGPVTVYGANRGEYDETFNVTIYSDATSVASAAVPLQNGSTTTITLSWNTTGFAKGNYTISAHALVVPGETNTANNNFTDGFVYVSMVGDLNCDGKVDGRDITIVAKCFGSHLGSPNYNPNCDLYNRGKIDGRDITVVAKNFGK
jgi:parallel beta-helix repeat protein